jgi:hypothetical protein
MKDIEDIEEAVKMIERVEDNKTTVLDTVTMSSGVTLKAKSVPITLLHQINTQYMDKRPVPPSVFIEVKGRSEPNRDDPDYIEAENAWQQEMTMAQLNVMLLKGVEVLTIPDGMEHWEITPIERAYYDSHPDFDVEDAPIPDWLMDLYLTGYKFDPRVNRKRYLYWMKFEACPTPADIEKISSLIATKAGVAEKDVDNSVTRFRD